MKVAIVLICDSRPALQFAAQLCQLANEVYLQQVPSCPHPYDLGVVYEPEDRCAEGDGTHTCEEERFDTIPIIRARGTGDCDDLACALAAWYRVREGDVDARAVVLPHEGSTGNYHAVVERGNGRLEDPSVALGMNEYLRRHGVAGMRRRVKGR